MAIPAMTGQNILVSKRTSYGFSLKIVYSNGEIIAAKIQAKIGTIVNLSVIALESLKGGRDGPRLWRVSQLQTRLVRDARK
jgi:hypothetical protein